MKLKFQIFFAPQLEFGAMLRFNIRRENIFELSRFNPWVFKTRHYIQRSFHVLTCDNSRTIHNKLKLGKLYKFFLYQN